MTCTWAARALRCQVCASRLHAVNPPPLPIEQSTVYTLSIDTMFCFEPRRVVCQCQGVCQCQLADGQSPVPFPGILTLTQPGIWIDCVHPPTAGKVTLRLPLICIYIYIKWCREPVCLIRCWGRTAARLLWATTAARRKGASGNSIEGRSRGWLDQ